jgi:hypothetical protein
MAGPRPRDVVGALRVGSLAGGSPQDGEGEQAAGSQSGLFGTPCGSLGAKSANDALSLSLLEALGQMGTSQILMHELHLETPVPEVGDRRSCDSLDGS